MTFDKKRVIEEIEENEEAEFKKGVHFEDDHEKNRETGAVSSFRLLLNQIKEEIKIFKKLKKN